MPEDKAKILEQCQLGCEATLGATWGHCTAQMMGALRLWQDQLKEAADRASDWEKDERF